MILPGRVHRELEVAGERDRHVVEGEQDGFVDGSGRGRKYRNTPRRRLGRRRRHQDAGEKCQSPKRRTRAAAENRPSHAWCPPIQRCRRTAITGSEGVAASAVSLSWIFVSILEGVGQFQYRLTREVGGPVSVGDSRSDRLASSPMPGRVSRPGADCCSGRSPSSPSGSISEIAASPLNRQRSAGPPSPASPASPLPAIVASAPLRSTRRIRCMPASAM